MMDRVRRVFESEFRYDPKTGLPRIWSPNDDIESCFSRAKESVERVVGLFERVNVDLDVFSDSGQEVFTIAQTSILTNPVFGRSYTGTLVPATSICDFKPIQA